ncbi:hypothetical protein GCM10009677_07190 [Sphaerisporangium rubeum]|uniref:Uncharacterized protein n=1 Tax=Sphaerisporangium rubeum TaxID=321317 RepID=A0A7X0IKG2_9ACTN|nr:hypothetical protein [Sphaerisporangium rubeum]MBB6476849.1 hypothetical protein [Sphaerisporangium rubeum]
MDDDDYVPVGEALSGLTVAPLPEGWTALGAIVLVKCFDEEGRSSWAFRRTDGLNDEELLGALTVRTDLLRRELLDAYTSDDEEDD